MSRQHKRLFWAAVAAGVGTLAVMQVFPPEDPIWRHLAYYVVVPGIWLYPLSQTQGFARAVKKWDNSKFPFLRVAALTAIISVASWYAYVVYRVRPIAPVEIAKQAPQSPRIFQPGTDSLPIISFEDALTFAFSVPARVPLPQSATSGVIAAMEKRIAELEAKLAASVAVAVPAAITPKRLPPITVTLDAETDASCVEFGAGTNPLSADERGLLERIATHQKQFNQLMQRLVAAAHGSLGNPDSQTILREALNSWNGQLENEVGGTFGLNAQLDFRTTAPSDDLLNSKDFAGVPFADSTKESIRRATAYLSCMQTIDANLRARSAKP